MSHYEELWSVLAFFFLLHLLSHWLWKSFQLNTRSTRRKTNPVINFVLKICNYCIFKSCFLSELMYYTGSCYGDKFTACPKLVKTKGKHFSSLWESMPEFLGLRSGLLGSLKEQFTLFQNLLLIISDNSSFLNEKE